MNGSESHHEIDDELLSAYLDDELSPEDRAAVEARLASDSSAAELLHQLRSVSQAVQALPIEQGRDNLREAVMERVGQISDKSNTPVAPSSSPTGAPVSRSATTAAAGSTPSFTIGRTRRGWIWASLAIAAALLIMVMQERPQRDNVAAVADRESEPENGRSRSRDLGFRSLAEENEQLAGSETAAPARAPSTSSLPAAPMDAAVAQSVEAPPTAEQLAFNSRGLQAGAGGSPTGQSSEQLAEATRGGYYLTPAPTSGATAGAAPESDVAAVAANEPAAMPPAAAKESQSDLGDTIALRDSPALLKQQSQSADGKFVVVRVVARKDALEANEFERLLERNGVEIVSATDEALSEDILAANARSRRFAVQDQARLDRRRQLQRESEPAEVEAVLVEAPQATIISCLDSLNKDNENYLGLAVENVQTEDGQVVANGNLGIEARAKAAESSDWAWRYNRGIVPQDKDAGGQDHYSYVEEQRSFGGGRFGGRAQAVEQLNQLNKTELSAARNSLREAKNGKAVRLQTWGVESSDRVEQLSRSQDTSEVADGVAATTERSEVQRGLSVTAPANSDDLQVLFLLQPDESAAPSPGAKARAQ